MRIVFWTQHAPDNHADLMRNVPRHQTEVLNVSALLGKLGESVIKVGLQGNKYFHTSDAGIHECTFNA